MHQNPVNRFRTGPGWLSRAARGLFGAVAAPLGPRLVPIEISRDDDVQMEALRRRDDHFDWGNHRR